jgi:serine protease inhibitor
MIARFSVLLIAMLLITGCVERTDEDDAATPVPAEDNNGQVSETPISEPEPDEGDDSDREAVQPPDEGTVDEVASSAGKFGFDLFTGLSGQDPTGNVITSPYSAAVLLTLLMNGADGETRQAIGDVLHLDDPFNDDINSQHQTLSDYLTSADPDVELAIANSLWANEGTPFEDDYMAAMNELFEAEVEEIDLGSEEAVETIDAWVSEQTRDRIEEIAEDLGVPDPNLVLILLNAVYFLGDWTDPFDPERTSDGPFTTGSGDEVEIPLMQKDDTHLHGQADGFQVLRLPYGDEERFGMEIFLPDEGTELEAFRDELDHEAWSDAIAQLGETRVEVVLPSFELEYSTEGDMDQVLQDLGMGIAYGGGDFTPMSSINPFLDTVIQKTYIRVDEEGTEAAAVTGGAMAESAPPQFRVDRPFIFTISDSETNTILFLGQVNDPSE